MHVILTLLPFCIAWSADSPQRNTEVEILSAAVRHLGTIRLESKAPPLPAVRNVFDFDIDDRGRIGFIRIDESDMSVVLVEASGEILAEVEIGDLGMHTMLPRVRWLGNDTWAVFVTEYKPESRLKAWTIDMNQQASKPMDALDCSGTEFVTGDRQGGFIVCAPTSIQAEYGSTTEELALIAFDAQGRKRWSVVSDHLRFVLSSMDSNIVVTTDRRIVLLCDNNQGLIVFTHDGDFVGTLESDATWVCMGHNVGLSADVNGGVIINDPYGTPALRRVSIPDELPKTQLSGMFSRLSGAVERKRYEYTEYEPRYSDERSLHPYVGVRSSPDGYLWSSDLHALYRLDENGVVDRVLGETESDQILRDVNDSFIDQGGRTYLVEGRTGSVHVFDSTGERVRVCQSYSSDYRGLPFCELAVTSAGAVYTWDHYCRYLRFAPDGTRLGFDRLGLGMARGDLAFRPRDDAFWLLQKKGFSLHSSEGRLLKTILNRPDGMPLIELLGAAVAPDGSIAVISASNDPKQNDSELPRNDGWYKVSLYSATGDPVRTHYVPKDRMPRTPTYNGDFIVFEVVEADDHPVWMMDAKTGKVARLLSATDGKPLAGRSFFSMDGRELWQLDIKTKTIERYGLPQRPIREASE